MFKNRWRNYPVISTNLMTTTSRWKTWRAQITMPTDDHLTAVQEQARMLLAATFARKERNLGRAAQTAEERR
jgi:hypothetical protein